MRLLWKHNLFELWKRGGERRESFRRAFSSFSDSTLSFCRLFWAMKIPDLIKFSCFVENDIFSIVIDNYLIFFHLFSSFFLFSTIFINSLTFHPLISLDKMIAPSRFYLNYELVTPTHWTKHMLTLKSIVKVQTLE